MNFSAALRISTPGSSPASHRIWKPLQTPSTSPPCAGMRAHRVHDRRARRDRAAAQIIAVGEAARHHHEVGARRQRGVGVPDHGGLAAGDELERARHVALAIDAGKDDDGGFHQMPELPLDPAQDEIAVEEVERGALGGREPSSATTVATTTSHLSLKAIASARARRRVGNCRRGRAGCVPSSSRPRSAAPRASP